MIENHKVPTSRFTKQQIYVFMAWLAKNMQQHRQTLFLIEQIQPSWLTTQKQFRVYILLSRLILGIVLGMTVGVTLAVILFVFSKLKLIQTLSGNVIDGVSGGLIAGLIMGLVVGFISSIIDITRLEFLTLRTFFDKLAIRWRIIINVLLLMVISGLIFGLIFAIMYSISREIRDGQIIGAVLKFSANFTPAFVKDLTTGATNGLFIGLLWTLANTLREWSKQVSNTRPSLLRFFMSWLISVSAGFIGLMAFEKSTRFLDYLGLILTVGFIGALSGGLFGIVSLFVRKPLWFSITKLVSPRWSWSGIRNLFVICLIVSFTVTTILQMPLVFSLGVSGSIAAMITSCTIWLAIILYRNQDKTVHGFRWSWVYILYTCIIGTITGCIGVTSQGLVELAPLLYVSAASLLFVLIDPIGLKKHKMVSLGLIISVFSMMIWNTIFYLILGAISGVVVAYFSGFESDVKSAGKSDFFLRYRIAFYFCVALSISGLISGLLTGIVNGYEQGTSLALFNDRFAFWLMLGLIDGVIIGLIFGLISGTRTALRQPHNEIQTVASLSWSWPLARKAFSETLVLWLSVGIIVGPPLALIIQPLHNLTSMFDFNAFPYLFANAINLERINQNLFTKLAFILGVGLFFGLTVGVIFGISVGLISSVYNGLIPRTEEITTEPNQGIRLTIRNAIFGGMRVGVILGVIIGLAVFLISWHQKEFNAGVAVGAKTGLVIGLFVTLLSALWYGGLDIIHHYVLRLILWQSGYMPLQYAYFLDYVAEQLNFLQKVGGGYMFIHRYLLEYFANLEDMT